jgi:hypothetical protein
MSHLIPGLLIVAAAILVGFWIFVEIAIPIITIIGLLIFFNSLRGKTLRQKASSVIKRFIFKK